MKLVIPESKFQGVDIAALGIGIVNSGWVVGVFALLTVEELLVPHAGWPSRGSASHVAWRLGLRGDCATYCINSTWIHST